jgi:hypothetical protein
MEHIETTTPKNAGPNYDWRKEPWVKEVSAAACELGMIIAVAMVADGDDEQEQDDEAVDCLVNPGFVVAILKTPAADEIVRYRVAHAVAMLIDDGVRRAKEAGMSFENKEPIF